MSEYVFLFYQQLQKNASDVILTQIKVWWQHYRSTAVIGLMPTYLICFDHLREKWKAFSKVSKPEHKYDYSTMTADIFTW